MRACLCPAECQALLQLLGITTTPEQLRVSAADWMARASCF
jgi:hypothetical protein